MHSFRSTAFVRPVRSHAATACALAAALLCAVPASAQSPAPEFRGLWVDTWNRGMNTSSQVTALVNDARSANFNAVVVQVRRRGDAFYSGGLEPKNPAVSPQSFDPLADLIAKAHAVSPPLEVHAWVVTYNIWNNPTNPPPQPDHPFNLHPDWLTSSYTGGQFDGSNFQFDPGVPAVQQHTFDVVMDIATRYDIDGIHFDYIRYSEHDSSGNNQPWGYHPESVARFRKLYNRTGTPAPTDSQWLQFRRDQVTALVRKVYLHAHAVKPDITVSAATITWGSPPSSSSRNAFLSTAAYSRVLQDWRGWMEEGILDLNIPMLYRRHYSSALETWIDRVQDMQFQRAGAIGLGIYLNDTAGTLAQISSARTPSPAGSKCVGITGYSYANPTVGNDSTRWASLQNALTTSGSAPPFAQPAPVSSMPWKSDPAIGNLMGTVTDGRTSEPADGAIVTVIGPVSRTLTADATGFFGAVGLPIGTYSLRAEFAPDLAPSFATIEVDGAGTSEWHTDLMEAGFEILSAGFNASFTAMELTWQSQPGRRYAVQTSANLQTWTTLVANLPSGGDTTTYRDFTAIPTGQKYYRIADVTP